MTAANYAARKFIPAARQAQTRAAPLFALVVWLVLDQFINRDIALVLNLGILTYLFVGAGRKIPRPLPGLLVGPTYLAIIGVLAGLAHSNDYYAITRDVFYTIKQFTYLYVCYIIARNLRYEFDAALAIIIAASFIAIYYLAAALVYHDLVTTDRDAFRRLVGYGANIVPIALTYLLFFRRKIFSAPLFRTPIVPALCFVLVVIGFLVPQSRTAIGAFDASCLIYVLVVHRQYLWIQCILLTLLVLQLFLATPLYKYIFTENDLLASRLVLPRSVVEIIPYTYTERLDIVSFYRGYEASLAYSQFNAYNIPEQIFGRGFGTSIRLTEVKRRLEGGSLDIDVMHNVYGHVIVKCGLLGIALYLLPLLLFVAQIGRFRRMQGERIWKFSFAAVTFMLILNGPLATGWISPGEGGIFVVLGFSLARLRTARSVNVLSVRSWS